MATRQNKKRKGRSNAPPRERTVTTLTDGPDGPFLPPPSVVSMTVADDHSLSSPFPVNVSPTVTGSQPPGLSATPYSLQPFQSPFPYYAHMSQHATGPTFPPSNPQLYSSTPVTQSISLPPGKNDLEILEKLKEAIKNNQHDLFRPIPQPAALARNYLGPRLSSGPVYVPPHPEQAHTVSGLTTSLETANNGGDTAPSTPNLPPRVPQTPDHRDTSRKSIHRSSSSVNQSPKPNAMQPPPSPIKRADRYSPSSSSIPTPLSRQDTDQRSSQRSIGGEANNRVDGHEHNGHAGELTESPGLMSAKLPLADPKDGTRPREPSWATRNGYDNKDHIGPPVSQYESRNGVAPPTAVSDRGLPPRDQRLSERTRERERDRERSRERDYDRDADRDRKLDHSRPRDREDRKDDRRIDDRRPSIGSRYEPRHALRRFDSKASENSLNSARREDRGPLDIRPPPRNLGEERTIVRPPLNVSALPSVSEERRGGPSPSGVDDHATRPTIPIIDDRRPLRSPQRPRFSDHRSPTVPLERPGDWRPPSLPAIDHSVVIVDDRRPPPASVAIDRASPRSLENHNALLSMPVTSISEKQVQVRPVDDHLPSVPTVPGERPPPAAGIEGSRPPSSITAPEDRPRLGEDRRPVLEERAAQPRLSASIDSLPARPLLEDRSPRPVQSADRVSRATLPLEERLSHPPSLQERLSKPAPSKADDKPAPRLEERLSLPAPPSLEARLSNPPTADSRPLRPLRPQPPLERPAGRLDDRSVLAEPARTASSNHHGERQFLPQAGHIARPGSPAASDRGRPPSRPPYRASSVAREEPPRSFRPISPVPARPLARPDANEFRLDPRDRERADSRPPYRPDPARYPPERRPSDSMNVDHPPRFSDTRPAYRRPSPPPVASYPPPPRATERGDRTWVPAGEAPTYRDMESTIRPPADPLSYPPREWPIRELERRPYGDELSDRSWDRSREYEREPAPADWETREERERREAYPPPGDVPPPARSAYDRVPGRYPPVEPPSSYPPRVRPRSPSPGPLRRGTASDDPRPPLKRPRDSSYPPPGNAGYYDRDEPHGPPPSEYPPRLRSPLPASNGYYNDLRYNGSPGRDREYIDSRDRDPAYGYREPPGRMLPPRSPPPYGRLPAYGRDDRRYPISR